MASSIRGHAHVHDDGFGDAAAGLHGRWVQPEAERNIVVDEGENAVDKGDHRVAD